TTSPRFNWSCESTIRFTKIRSLICRVFSIEPDGIRNARKKNVRITNEITTATTIMIRISFRPPQNPPERLAGLRPLRDAVIALFSPVDVICLYEAYPCLLRLTWFANLSNHTGYLLIKILCYLALLL